MSRKTGVILSYVYMMFQVLSTLLLTPFIIRTLGQAEYGVYKLVFAINAYLLLLDLGMGNSIIRYIAMYKAEGNKEKERQFFALSVLFYAIIGIIALIAGFILIKIFPIAFARGLSKSEVQLAQKLLLLTMLNSALVLGTSEFGNIIIAYEHFAVSRISSILEVVARMIFTCIVLKAGWGSFGIVVINLITSLINRLFFVLYVLFVIKLKPLFKNISMSFMKDIIVYSSLILLQMIATQLNASVDQVLIGALVQSSAVILAVYSVGSQIVQYFQTIGSSFTNVLMPGIVRLVEKHHEMEEIVNEMVRIGRIILMVLIIIWSGFLVCGREFIILWAGKANEEGFIVALLLMTAQLFILAESVGTQVLWAMNEHKEQSILKFVIVIVNIIFTVMLIKWNPLIGATIGTVVSLLLGDVVVMNLIFKKKFNMKLSYYYGELFEGILQCTLLTIIIGLLVSKIISFGWIGLLINIIIMIVVYCFSMWCYGMNQYEKKLVLSVVNKKNK